jgi:hypothetical protein
MLIQPNLGGRLTPGVVVFSALGFVGQASWNRFETWRQSSTSAPAKPFLQRLADSRWVPLRSLSDEDFRRVLNEKLLSIESDIALIDDKIRELQSTKREGAQPMQDTSPQKDI